MKKSKTDFKMRLTISLVLTILASHSFSFGVKRTSPLGYSASVGEGIPIGNDKTKLGQFAIHLVPNNLNILAIWNFYDIELSDPEQSII